MPHISKFLLDGERIKSVNEITDSLSKEGLIRNFYRKEGFKKADKISKAAREQGIKLADTFERYRQTGKTGKVSAYNRKCVDQWTEWFNASPFQIVDDKYVEIHLVNTVDKYHGSPDVIMHKEIPIILGTQLIPVLGDDKSKKRFADYKLIMNEHAYAMCDSYEDPVTHEIKKLPWEPPIPQFWFWTYHPITGRLYPVDHEFQPEVYQDFLTCKKMSEVNARAEKYFGQYAVLLPEEKLSTSPMEETNV